MYRFGAMLLAASLLVGCSGKPADETAKKAVKNTLEKSANEKTAELATKLTPEEMGAVAESAFAGLRAESQKSEAEFMQKVRSAPQDEQMELFQTGGERKKFAAKFLELAKAYPDTANEFAAIQFAAEKGDESVSSEAMELINTKFVNDERLLDLLNGYQMTAGPPEQKHEDFLQNIIDHSTNPSIKGAATFTLTKMLQMVAEVKVMMADQPEMAKMLPPASAEYLGKDRGDLDAKLEKMFEDVAENYPDVEFGRKTLGELAEDELFVFKYLSLGKVAPEIDGIDLDDKPFKLSDYRGKVVMLDFWGDW